MNKKKLIIFGGSFDPIHKGHLKIALKAFKKIKANKLFFVPCKNHPQNKHLSASDQQRVDMIKLMIKGINNFEVCEYELGLNDVSYTINTINYFKQEYQDYDLYLLIGYDQLKNFKSWHEYKQILESVKLICHKRKIEKDAIIPEDIPFIKIGFTNIDANSSSLKIYPKSKFLDKEVEKYINENGVYAIDRLKTVMGEYRLEHSIRVADLARKIAKENKYYTLLNKAYVAGLYHDYAKELKEDVILKYARKLKIKKFPSWKVLHGPVGAYILRKRYNIDDYQILTAIRNHVIPEDKSILVKIIYCADKLDVRVDGELPERNKLIKICKKDINEGFDLVVNKLKEIYGN